jgi:hypothetical protein
MVQRVEISRQRHQRGGKAAEIARGRPGTCEDLPPPSACVMGRLQRNAEKWPSLWEERESAVLLSSLWLDADMS